MCVPFCFRNLDFFSNRRWLLPPSNACDRLSLLAGQFIQSTTMLRLWWQYIAQRAWRILNKMTMMVVAVTRQPGIFRFRLTLEQLNFEFSIFAMTSGIRHLIVYNAHNVIRSREPHFPSEKGVFYVPTLGKAISSFHGSWRLSRSPWKPMPISPQSRCTGIVLISWGRRSVTTTNEYGVEWTVW